MAGIYIHIPFCKKACHYCDFHFSTSFKYKDEMVLAICKELVLKKDRIKEEIGTIYFGGGTPSVLSLNDFQKIFETILSNYVISEGAEITMEANPDDLSLEKIREFKQLPINRFSIGVQSFFEEDLLWMNRAHSTNEAEASIKRSQDAGFENLSIDLIYGYPLLTDKKWLENLEKGATLDIPHISSYSLTVENKTALADFIRKGKQIPISDAQSANQFQILTKTLSDFGFEHYEISNFAKPGKYAVHNTNYWRGVSYLGIGPSAHGFNGETRNYNIANNEAYLKALLVNNLAETVEVLSDEDRYNEYIMTSLRTMWGTDLEFIKKNFPSEFYKSTINSAESIIKEGKLILDGDKLILSAEGKLFADGIASELFILKEE